MRTTKNRWGTRLGAAAGALALAAMAIVAPASAAPVPGDIDQDATGSIIVHKHEHQTDTSATANPEGTQSIPSSPIAGVVFTVYPITSIDLSDNDDWAAIAANPAITVSGSTVTVADQAVGAGTALSATGTDGVATASGLDVGAYVVVETSAPTNVVDRAQPFIVTIPTPYSDGWVYDVNVYPKNGVASIEKTVTPQANLGLGATASFPVTVDVPTIADNANYTHFWIRDDLDSRLTSVSAGNLRVLDADGTPDPTSTALLTVGTDYVVQISGNAVAVNFTPAGLLTLEGLAGKKIEVTFSGVVSSLGDGSITNTADFSSGTVVAGDPGDPNDPANPNPPDPTDPADPNYPFNPNPPNPPTPSDPVTTNWGDLKINKVNAGSSQEGLNDAVFEVYAASDPYAGTAADAGSATGAPISVNGQTQFTSVDGLVNIAGLFVSDSENPSVDAEQRWYVVREVTAPAGYVLPSNPDTVVAVTIGATAAHDVEIENVQSSVPNLPLTGSGGTLLLTLIGGGLVLAGGAAALVARKRKQNA